LLTESQFNGSVLLRFVVRSESKLPLVERELPKLLEKLPDKSVVSLNIQPKHAAILEGEKEIILTEAQTIEERFNQIPLFIRPQGFFQTNPQVAEQLYRTAQQWAAELPVNYLWDLFCGVGGFGLHCLSALQKHNSNARLTGIEISPSAISAATLSAQQLHLKNVSFASLDAANFALNDSGEKPDLVIVNPPRRGIGQTLAEFLNTLGSEFIIYSSCNAETMAKDLEFLTAYHIQKVQLFDMFPHTEHYEVLTLLQRQ
jgi:23S rRNA (uracil747-C5)-methyltransferase